MDDRNPHNPILMVDDEKSWLNTLRGALKILADITHVDACTDSRCVPDLLKAHDYSLVLLDLTMPHLSGEELLDHINENHPEIPVIVVSGANQVSTAVNCIKKGAQDFFLKTDDLERIVNSIKKSLRERELRIEHTKLAENFSKLSHSPHPAFEHIKTQSSAMFRIFSYLEAIALSREPVLIQGESGTGKDLIAQALHHLCCPDAPFIAVNVAGLDDMLFSDALFGHVKGAFTGAEQTRKGMIEEAAGGILFLDEIGDLSQASQVKLLRLLQSGEYYPLGSDSPMQCKARIVAATNQNLEENESKGTFRRDLLFRLKTHRITLPALRNRKEDVPLLVDFFVLEAARSLGKKPPAVPSDLLALLRSYHFPGNHRELRAMIYDAVSLHQGGELSTARFHEAIQNEQELVSVRNLGDQSSPVPEFLFPEKLPTIKEMNELLVNEALRRTNGNQSQAAKSLGISQQALNKRIKKTVQ